MPDLAVFSTKRGLERVWVPRGEESEWIARFGRSGEAAALWRDYIANGRKFYPHPESVGEQMFYPATRGKRARVTP